jgi:hypothetical protein
MKIRKQQRSIQAVETEARELVRNVLALNPSAPAVHLLESALSMAPPDFLADLDGLLHSKYLLSLFRRERTIELREKRAAQWRTPKIRDVMLKLPVRIRIADGETVARKDFEYSHIRKAMALLNREDLDHHKNNVKLQALRELQELWPREKRARRMTAAQLDLFL